MVSFKVEVAGDELWQQDPEGISLAQALNSRLPPEVSLQPDLSQKLRWTILQLMCSR